MFASERPKNVLDWLKIVYPYNMGDISLRNKIRITHWSRWYNIFVEKSCKWIFIIFPFFWLEHFSIVIIRSFWNTVDKICCQIKNTWECKTQWKITNEFSRRMIIGYESVIMNNNLPPHGSMGLFWWPSNEITESTSSLTGGRELSPCQGHRDSRNHL